MNIPVNRDAVLHVDAAREASQMAPAAQRRLCLIHIGYHRTGSSFLQTALFPLIDNSVMSQSIGPTESNVADPAHRLAILTNEALSSDLTRDKPEMAAELARKFPDARILIGIRSQYSAMRGVYHLHTKSGATESYEEFVKARCGRLFDYVRTVDAYRKAFGADNVFVLPHEDLSRDPLGRMAALLQFVDADPALAVRVHNSRVKSSAGDPTMTILRGRNRLIAPLRRLWPWAHVKITRYGLPGSRLIDRLFDRQLRLPMDRVRSLIHDTYADGNARLFASLGLNTADYDYPFPGRS